GLKKGDERRGFRWTQVFSVSWHVAATLNHLADQLILRKPHGDAVECWTSLSAKFTERMAIAALFDLKHESSLPLKRSAAMQKVVGYGVTAPSVHVRAPRRIASEMGERSQDYGDQQNRQNS